MNKMLSVVLCAMLLGFAGAPDAGAAEESAIVEGNNAFALELYAKLSREAGNLFLSPYSISTALAMTYAGAWGETEAQMAKVLHLGKNDKDLHAAFGKLVADLNAAGKEKGYQLSVANALWAQQDYKFLKDYTDLVAASYGAGLNLVDFKGATEAVRQTINAWVEKQTQDKIKELLKPGVLNALTRLVLTNAIYFKGDWASQFKKEATKDEPFTLTGGKKVNVPMMNQAAKFRYGETPAAQVLELPYVKEDLSMIMLLPKKADGLAELEQAMNAKTLADWTMRMRIREVIVSIPRFKMTCEFSLNGVLQELGMTDAFTDGKADFSGMDGSRYLSISAVVHKAFVDVNEEGTEAAAATAVVVALTAAVPREEPVVFRADHPFVFIIRDNRTRSVLFIGRVADPTK